MQKPLENLFGKKKNKKDTFDVQEITDEKVIEQLEQKYNTITNEKVDINEAPKIQEITRVLPRPFNDGLIFTGDTIAIPLKLINLMQVRTNIVDPAHVSQIVTYMRKNGIDPKELPPAVVKYNGKYYLINGHHTFEAVKKIGYSEFNFDLYEYVGVDQWDIFVHWVKSLGRKINLTARPPELQQKPLNISNGYVKELVENEKRTGIAYLLTDDKGNPIPFKCNEKYDPDNLDHIDIVFERDGITDRYDPQGDSSGKKSVYTKMRKWVADYRSANTVSDIIPFDSAFSKRIEKTKMFSKTTIDGLEGHIINVGYTTSAAKDIFASIMQALAHGKNARILIWNSELDDPNKHEEDEKKVFEFVYKLWTGAMIGQNILVKNNEEERHQVLVHTYPREQFFQLFELFVASQLKDKHTGDYFKREKLLFDE